MRELLSPIYRILLLFILVIGFFQSSAQEVLFNDKIDPAFQVLIRSSENKNKGKGEIKFPTHFVPEPILGFAPGKTVAEAKYNCIIYTNESAALKDSGIIVHSQVKNFVTAWISLDEMQRIAAMPGVKYIEAPEKVDLHNDIATASSGAALLHAGAVNNTAYKGKGVIVAIYDTGIDWDHPDFRDPADQSKSRILRIWDQTITATTGETPPAGFSYGVEYTQAHINNELAGINIGFVREKDTNGHGTHVAGTAAGNGASLGTMKYMGMAPEADLVIIKGGNSSFSADRIIDALTYLQNLSTILGKPVVLNMSLGGQFGPHDGTRNYEVAVDAFTSSAPGRAVVISAGNDHGDEIHNKFSLSPGQSNTVNINASSATAGSDVFQYRMYANSNADVSASFSAPSFGGTVTANAGQSITNPVLSNAFNATVTNLIEVGNGHRYVDVYVSRNGSNSANPAGTWSLTVTNNSASTITIDGWLYYRNSNYATTSLVGGDNVSLVGSPGNATTAITVGSYVGKASWYSKGASSSTYGTSAQGDNISPFSARGPRRDGVLKPEIAAHGQHVISCLSSDGSLSPTSSDVVEPGLYRKNQGTSMSAPVVTGAVALMLSANPSASASQIKTLITANAYSDDMTVLPGALPNTTWGYGKLDVYKATAAMFNCSPNRQTLYYDQQGNLTTSDNGTTVGNNTQIAVRFTPTSTGKLSGVFFHPSTTHTSTIVEVRSNNSNKPGTLLATKSLTEEEIGRYAWNYVDFSNANIDITNGNDYFVVLRRNPAATTGWSIRRENSFVNNRSFSSTDGISWSTESYDYKIRTVTHNNSVISGSLPSSFSSDTRNISTSNQFLSGSCGVIARLQPSGINPVSGTVTAKVWIETSVPAMFGTPYVARHYEIMPQGDAVISTGKITLYFTQAEFNAFNADAGSTLNLPTSSSDAAGIANLRVGKYQGSTNNGSGLPNSYTNGGTVIDPADTDIVWNATASRWEVSFNETSFGGYILQTSATVLSISIDYFRGNKDGDGNALSWKINTNENQIQFDIERSNDGNEFTKIGTLFASRAETAHSFNFRDNTPLQGKNYYRIRMTEPSGRKHYTSVILLESVLKADYVSPSIINKGGMIQVSFNASNGTLILNDAAGKKVATYNLARGVQTITAPANATGTYFYTIRSGNSISGTGKIIIQ